MKDRNPYSRWRSKMLLNVLLLGMALVFTGLPSATAQEVQPDSSSNASTEPVDPWAGVEEMLVTGSGTASLLGDLAQANSVTAFDEETLQAIGAGDISDLAAFTPNLEIVTAGATSPTFFIRGIGLNDFNSNAAGAVSIYQDDVALNSPALQLGSLFDIETANVLRGPQGTGAYRNASAGAIKSYSKKPSGDFGGNLTVDYGNYDLVDVQGAVEMPIVPTLSARLAFRLHRRGGIVKNRCAGAPAFEDRTVFFGPGRGTTLPYAFCGETVAAFGGLSNGLSQVQPLMSSHLNQQRNFAARGVLRFQPELDGDINTEWIGVFRGTRIDQPSNVGQSIGTQGSTFPDDNNQAIQVQGLFGGSTGPNNAPYQDLDIKNMLERIKGQLLATASCAPNCTAAQQRRILRIADRANSFQLARDLDSDPFAGAYDTEGKTRNETYGISIKGDTDFSDAVHLRTVFGFDHWKRHVAVDLDFTPNINFETSTDDKGHQFFGEAALSGTVFESWTADWAPGPVDWEVGVFTLNEDLDVHVDINYGILSGINGAPPARDYTQTIESYAGYLDLSWDFFEVFTLDGGVRFNWERRGIDYDLFQTSGQEVLHQNEEVTNSEPTGTIRLTYNATTDISFYAKYTRGWKSGTFNATGDVVRQVNFAKPEKIDAFEVGTHQNYFDGLFNLYVSFFHYSYQDYQLFTSQTDANSPPVFVILNASDVELYGSEIEGTLTPWEGGLAEVKFAWLEGEFLEFVQGQIYSIPDGTGIGAVNAVVNVDNSGNRLLNAPQFTVNLTLQQTFPLGNFGYLTARWDGAWKDDTYFDASEGRGLPNDQDIQFMPDNSIGQDSYWIHNVRLGFRTIDGTLGIAGWVRNVADKHYKTYSADLSTFSDTTLHFVGDPRTYGMSVSLTF